VVRQRYLWAAFLLGVGACLKLYPLFFLAPLVLERLAASDRQMLLFRTALLLVRARASR